MLWLRDGDDSQVRQQIVANVPAKLQPGSPQHDIRQVCWNADPEQEYLRLMVLRKQVHACRTGELGCRKQHGRWT
jgi:hypothetical protein